MNTTTDTRPLVQRITQQLEPRESMNDTPAFLDRGIKYSPAWVECAWDGNAEAEANVELIYDAFETAHRTRRTPSELASERDSLAAAVLAWWKDHQFDECCDRNVYPKDPPFVTLAQRLTEPPANIS